MAANGSGNLTLTADSVAFKHGCLKPDSSCFRVIYRFPVPAGHNSSRIEKLIITDYLGLVEEDSKAKNIDQLKQVLVKNAMSYDSSYVEIPKQFGSSIEWFINVDFSQVSTQSVCLPFVTSNRATLAGHMVCMATTT